MSHEFQHIDICPAAKLAFRSYKPTEDEHHDYAKAALKIDTACGILKRGYAAGSLSEHDYDELVCLLEEAEEILEEIGVLDDHDYIRDDLEARAAELLNLDGVDVSDDADEVADTDAWIFGSGNESSDD